jgi:hypothetical protein
MNRMEFLAGEIALATANQVAFTLYFSWEPQ